MESQTLPEWLTPKDAAKHTRFSWKTLERWRYQKKGPRYSSVNGRIRYRRCDLDAYLESLSVEHGGAG